MDLPSKEVKHAVFFPKKIHIRRIPTTTNVVFDDFLPSFIFIYVNACLTMWNLLIILWPLLFASLPQFSCGLFIPSEKTDKLAYHEKIYRGVTNKMYNINFV